MSIKLHIKWRSTSKVILVEPNSTLLDLKNTIFSILNIIPTRQSLLWKNKPLKISDNNLLIDIGINPNINNNITLIGTPGNELEQSMVINNNNESIIINEPSILGEINSTLTKTQTKPPQKKIKSTIKYDKFINQQLKFIDEIARDCSYITKMDELINYFIKQINIISKYKQWDNNLIIARMIFAWIANNIEYDIEAYSKEDYSGVDNIDHIFNTKKTCCSGYANLFKFLCLKCGVNNNDVHVITGRAKGLLKDNETLNNMESNHAWNCVKINNKLELIDTCWAYGTICNGESIKRYDDFWFCTPAEYLVFTHLPDDKQWLFLNVEVVLDEWIQLPLVAPCFFRFNLDFYNLIYKPSYEHMVVKSGTIIDIKFITHINILLVANLINEHDKCDHDATCVTGNPLDDIKKITNVCCNFQNKKGKHKLNIFAGQINDCKYYICSYKFLVE